MAAASRKAKYPKSGEVLCSYTIGQTLGQGAFGTVKLATKPDAEDDNKQREYAVKFIDKSQMDDLDDVERIYRESAILTSLKHPNIIRLYEVLDATEWVLLVMEFAKGGELKDFISTKQNQILSEHLACDILNATINGLEYCHRRKVIHRDLKLENILIDTKGTIKIADFGLSNTIQFGKKMNTSCGTPSYIAPEIVRGDAGKSSDSVSSKSSGAECDIWSLGVILYCMICGFLPFQASNIKGLYDKILRADFTIPDYISTQSKSLITKMLTVDLEKRINLSQIRNHVWTQMRGNGLIEKIKARPQITAEQIEIANHFNCTRKKPKKAKAKEDLLASVEEDLETEETVELNDTRTSDPLIKHSKSLDRELELYLRGKSSSSKPLMPKRSPSKRRASAAKATINTFKNKLNRLKLNKPASRTPRKKGKHKETAESKRRKVKSPDNRKKNGSTSSKHLKNPRLPAPAKSINAKQGLLTPDPEPQKIVQFHSPIVDSIMQRRTNFSSTSTSSNWKMDLKDYDVQRKPDPRAKPK